MSDFIPLQKSYFTMMRQNRNKFNIKYLSEMRNVSFYAARRSIIDTVVEKTNPWSHLEIGLGDNV